MSRRSARLVSGGYYRDSDDDSDSSSASVCYRESPISKVFNKRRTVSRKTVSVSRDSFSAGPTSNSHHEPIINAIEHPGLAPALRSSQRRQTFRAPSGVHRAPVPVLAQASPAPHGVYSSSSGYSSSEQERFTTTSASSRSMTQSAPAATVTKALYLFLFTVLIVGLCYMYSVQTTMSNMPLNTMDRTTVITTPVTTTTNSAMENQLNNMLKEMKVLQQKLSEREFELQQVKLVSQRLQTDIKDVRVRVENVDTDLGQRVEAQESHTVKLQQDLSINHMTTPPPTSMTPDLEEALEKWFSNRGDQDRHTKPSGQFCDRPLADKMADFAIESQGASVFESSNTYRTRSACWSFFGIPLFYPYESSRTVLQGNDVMQPGRCWAFEGSQGFLSVSLSHPVTISHVTLDHLSRFNHPTGTIDSAPKDFEVYGMSFIGGGKTLLGTFTYDRDGDSSQTFQLPNADDTVYRFVELRVLSNWGNPGYTCVYRFRVHGQVSGVNY